MPRVSHLDTISCGNWVARLQDSVRTLGLTALVHINYGEASEIRALAPITPKVA